MLNKYKQAWVNDNTRVAQRQIFQLCPDATDVGYSEIFRPLLCLQQVKSNVSSRILLTQVLNQAESEFRSLKFSPAIEKYIQ